MTKDIVVTMEDFKTYRKFIYSRMISPREKSLKSLFFYVVLWIMWIFFITMVFHFSNFKISELHWPTAIIVSFPLLVFIIANLINSKKIEKRQTPNENGILLGERTIEFSDSGFEDINSLSSCTYKWKALEEVVVYENNVYLLLDSILAQIIPSSAFRSENELREFVAEIEKKHSYALQSTT